MSEIPFQHLHAAHCESGVTAALLRHSGLDISEALALGIGSGLFFIHLPLKHIGGGPSTSFRGMPGRIFPRVCKRLGVEYRVQRYRDPDKGTTDLDLLVQQGVPAGVQTNVYWLSHIPRRFRFQFNAHNLIVYGRRNGSWMVSDPVLEAPLECTDDSLRRARFAKGFLAPRGRLYHLTDVPKVDEGTLNAAIRKGSHHTAWAMSRIPLPLFGAKGIAFLANRIERWPDRFPDPNDCLLQLANVVRMLEEIGTGGAGFRYVYAAFLQEAGERLSDPAYRSFSERLTGIGDQWRQFSARVARVCRSRKVEGTEFREVAGLVRECARGEQSLFDDVLKHEAE
jgi:uncharacterized protein DUF4872/butirosin biosynthesis protein H-like